MKTTRPCQIHTVKITRPCQNNTLHRVKLTHTIYNYQNTKIYIRQRKTKIRIAKQRIATWADENGLIGGEAPSGKHCIEWFGLYFEQCRQDPFITGEGGRSKGHENWKPGFEYLLRAEVMEARVLEGD
ncbi:hypothetical protein [Eikenella corrodens]|uniref:hypothetical protein n=1 Tax=Eikenella corrodens TaxID=539 RepID=UPI001F03D4DF|nr:hypothetical protein [Eikenella corrodens]